MNNYLEYAKAFNASEEVLNWIKTTLAATLRKEPQPAQQEIEHILDYLCSARGPKKLRKMSYAQAKTKTEEWSKAQQKKGADIDEGPEDIRVIKKFKNGARIVELIGQNAFKREGFLMRHCVASYYGGSKKVYSYRDADNMPHVTFEVDKQNDQILQIKGKGNGSIHPNYIKPVVAFLKHVGMEVRGNEMQNLGYYYLDTDRLKLAKEFCHKILTIKLGNKRFIYGGSK